MLPREAEDYSRGHQYILSFIPRVRWGWVCQAPWWRRWGRTGSRTQSEWCPRTRRRKTPLRTWRENKDLHLNKFTNRRYKHLDIPLFKIKHVFFALKKKLKLKQISVDIETIRCGALDASLSLKGMGWMDSCTYLTV